MNQSEDIRKTQRSFARKAQAEPEHRFQDLWHLLGREDWIWVALNAVLANQGARTPGTDGISKEELENRNAKSRIYPEPARATALRNLLANPRTPDLDPQTRQAGKAPARNTDDQGSSSTRTAQNAHGADLGK